MDTFLRFNELGIKRETIFSEIGYGRHVPEESVQRLVDELLHKAVYTVLPRFYFQVSDGILADNQLKCGIVDFNVGRTIAMLLKNSEKFAFFAASAGPEYQDFHNRLANEGDTLSLFIWDTIGSCIAEAAGDLMERALEKELDGTPHTNRFSPGYCGWHVSEQQLLFSILPENVCGISLNSSALMYPIKSISGVIGCGAAVDTRKYGCQFCELDNCYKKRKKQFIDNATQYQQ